MEYKEFTEEIKVNLSGLLGPGKEVFLQNNLKNNDTYKCGVVIKEKKSNIALTIYLEEYYDKFQEGESIEGIVDDIILFSATTPVPKVSGRELFDDFTLHTNKLMYKLVAKDNNDEFLRQHPHREYYNMAIVYCLLLEVGEKGCLSVMIRNEHLEFWKKTEDDLYHMAQNNTVNMLPVRISGLNDMVKDMMLELGVSIPLEDNDAYILTNKYCYYGAGTLLYEDTLKMVHKVLGSNYYVLPTSVHEVLVIPKTDDSNTNEIKKMMDEIRLDMLSVNLNEEILSETLFYYENDLVLI